MRKWFAFLLLISIAVPAQADWYEASSDNFVIYADDSAKDVEAFATMLERYHAAMSLLTNHKPDAPSPSARVVIYAVGSTSKINALAGADARNVAGFYIPRAGGSRAFVPDTRPTTARLDFSFVVLLHEYAHHYLMSTSRFVMPRWYSEGAAEFFASSQFPSDGSVKIGMPAYHRGTEFAYATDVPVQELLNCELYEKNRRNGYDAFYGRSWALFHYLIFDETRSGQLKAYTLAITGGKPPAQAAMEAFGDLTQLERDLDKYIGRRSMKSFAFKPAMVPIGPVHIRKLSAGHAEAMPLIIRSQRDVDQETAQALLPKIREVAARYPQDAHVLTALAEAEVDAGNNAEAVAEAGKAIAIDRNITEAYVQQGRALFNLAQEATGDTRAQAYRAAMKPFTKLNAIEVDHPLPLIFYYRSFVERGLEPNAIARKALERALQLAPFDQNLAMQVGVMQAKEGKLDMARDSLTPVANDPHGGNRAKAAQLLISAMAKTVPGKPFNPSAIVQNADTQAQQGEEGSDAGGGG